MRSLKNANFGWRRGVRLLAYVAASSAVANAFSHLQGESSATGSPLDWNEPGADTGRTRTAAESISCQGASYP